MKYKESKYRAQKKYDDSHYHKQNIKIPLDLFNAMQKSELYKNNSQFIKECIKLQLIKEGLLKSMENTESMDREQAR